MKRFIFLINLYLIINMNVMAQDFSKHKWENRLVLIFTQDRNNSIYEKQLKELIKNEEGLLERKILVYHILPDRFKVGLETESVWENNTKEIVMDVPFKINLIGLDGGIKLSQDQFLTADKLFTLIDKMPMRRIEIENKN